MTLINRDARKWHRKDLPCFANPASSPKLEGLHSGGDGDLTVGDDDLSTTVRELGGDVIIIVSGVLRLNGDIMRTPSSCRMDGEEGLQLREGSVTAGGVSTLRSHVYITTVSMSSKEACGGVFTASIGVVGAAELVRVHAKSTKTLEHAGGDEHRQRNKRKSS